MEDQEKKKEKNPCANEGCEKKSFRRGLCRYHYYTMMAGKDHSKKSGETGKSTFGKYCDIDLTKIENHGDKDKIRQTMRAMATQPISKAGIALFAGLFAGDPESDHRLADLASSIFLYFKFDV